MVEANRSDGLKPARFAEITVEIEPRRRDFGWRTLTRIVSIR